MDHATPLLLRRAGHLVTVIDTKLHGISHDVLRPEVADFILSQITAGEFDCVFVATPCSSFSVRHPKKIRSKARPRGVDPMPAEWAAYVSKHNKIADFSISVLNACDESNIPWGLENPADRSDESSPAFWELHADRGSLWQLKEIRNISSRADVQKFTFPQCHEKCGGRAQKWTTISASGHLATQNYLS